MLDSMSGWWNGSPNIVENVTPTFRKTPNVY